MDVSNLADPDNTWALFLGAALMVGGALEGVAVYTGRDEWTLSAASVVFIAGLALLGSHIVLGKP